MASPSPLAPHNRRELTRLYKETRRPAGIFVIRNTANGRVLVGGSGDVDGALNRHRFELRMRGHRNRALQQDWNAFGPDSFILEVIDRVRERDDPAFDYKDELAALLEAWRAELTSAGQAGYATPEVQA